MTILTDLVDELLKGCQQPEDLLGDARLIKDLKLRLVERMLGAELKARLGYEDGAEPPAEQLNRRNGVATKRVRSSLPTEEAATKLIFPAIRRPRSEVLVTHDCALTSDNNPKL